MTRALKMTSNENRLFLSVESLTPGYESGRWYGSGSEQHQLFISLYLLFMSYLPCTFFVYEANQVEMQLLCSGVQCCLMVLFHRGFVYY